MTLQLDVKISTRYSELKFQFGFAKPGWNFNLGWKFQVFHFIDIFSNLGWKFDTTHVQLSCLFFKNLDGDSTSTFRMTFHKLSNRIKCSQEFKSFIELHRIYNMHRSYVNFSFLNIRSFQWLQAFELIIVI